MSRSSVILAVWLFSLILQTSTCFISPSPQAPVRPTPTDAASKRLSPLGCELGRLAPSVPFPSATGDGPVYAAGGGFGGGRVSAASLIKVLVVFRRIDTRNVRISVTRSGAQGIGYLQISGSAHAVGMTKTIENPPNPSIEMSSAVSVSYSSLQNGDYMALPSYLYVDSPGCYHYQITWDHGSEAIGFEVGAAN